MRKSIWKYVCNFTGPTPYGFTWGLVLLKDLPKTANTVWYFHAQITKSKGENDNIYKYGINVNKVVNDVI